MDAKSPLSTSQSVSPTAHIVTLKFALHSNRNLRLSLHTHVSTNPHIISTRTAALPANNDSGDRFAVIDAKRVVGITHLGTAANSAFLRLNSCDRSSSAASTVAGDASQVGRKRRGAALETVLCAGGSTNVGSVLKDFAFDRNSMAASDAEKSPESTERRYDVLFLGYDCETDEEFIDVLSSVGLDPPVDECQWKAYFERDRDDKELREIAKLFKISPEELIMDDFSLEKSVLNRVAVKYSI